MVLALYLEGLPSQDDAGGISYYDPDPLMEAACAAFALGCALAIESPQQVMPVLKQTHPDDAEAIVAECTPPLLEQVAEARASSAELRPELFLEALLEALEESEPVEAEVAYNIISIAFEYGCILAHVERRAALTVRNGFNRLQAQALSAQAGQQSEDIADAPRYLAGPDPHRPVQDLARELLSAYEQDIGFGQVTA